MDKFVIFPAIDLRDGKVVRLVQGDASRMKVYSDNPAQVASRWAAEGAKWLHVVNLDGAFGEVDVRNINAIKQVLSVSENVNVQLGGGIRSLDDIKLTFDMGINRVIVGTLAISAPDTVALAIEQFGPNRVAAGIDARSGFVRIKGWTEKSGVDAISLGNYLAELGVKIAIYTNIERDGLATGIDMVGSVELAQHTGLSVIASGGVASVNDIQAVRKAGLSGVIVGRALYEGAINLKEALIC